MPISKAPNIAKVASIAELFLYYDEQFVQGAYHFFLDRDADPVGLGTYLEQLRSGTPRHQVARTLGMSGEAKKRKGMKEETHGCSNYSSENVSGSMTTDLRELCMLNDRAFVEAAYQIVLAREPDCNGMSTYLRQIRAGMSKIGILNGLINSPEFAIRKASISKLSRAKTISDQNEKSALELVRTLETAAKRYRFSQLPILGILLRLIFDIESESESERRIRRLENQLYLLSSQDFDVIEERVLRHQNPAQIETCKDYKMQTKDDFSFSKSASDVTIVRSASSKLRTLAPRQG